MAIVLPLAMIPAANAQVSITVGTPPPSCPYGYYDYPPYACAPVGYYGPGYFYNGIFLGVGPWAGWGYRHGWGGHRFEGPRGGRYWPQEYRRDNYGWHGNRPEYHDAYRGGDRGDHGDHHDHR